MEIDEKFVIEEYLDNKSTGEIAKALNTYPKKISRILNKNGIEIRSKSESQKIAIQKGIAKHPTKGKKRTKEQKLHISKQQSAIWKNKTKKQREEISAKHKEHWESKSPEEKILMQKKAMEAMRLAAKEGSKAEKFLYEKLTRAGYYTILHKRNFIEGREFEIDIFLPALKIVIEVDGPTHWSDDFGAKERQFKRDQEKNGALLGKGYCVMRIKYMSKSLTQRVERDLWDALLPHIRKIDNKFPPKGKRLIELEIK